MAEITARRRGELVRKVFEVLQNHPDGLPAKDILQWVERNTPITDYERSDYPNSPGVRRFEKIVRFSTIAAVKAGWLVKEKGRWTLTDEGRKAYKSFGDPERFDREAARLYREWASTRPESEPDEPTGEPAVAAATIEEAEENAWRETEDYLLKMPPYDFQNLVAALLRGMGYHVSWIAPPGPDAGIDIVAHGDPLGTTTPRVKVQVKRRQDKTAVDGLRSFMALLSDHDVGLFVSTGGFTKDAEAEARKQEKRQITLVSLERLFDLWVEHYKKIDEQDRQLLPLKPVYYLAPNE